MDKISNRISFFTLVTYGNLPPSFGKYVLNKVEKCFYFGGKKAYVIPEYIGEKVEKIAIFKETISWKQLILKIVFLATVILPSIVFIAKIILRLTHNFEEIEFDAEIEIEIKKVIEVSTKINDLVLISNGNTSVYLFKDKKLIFKVPQKSLIWNS